MVDAAAFFIFSIDLEYTLKIKLLYVCNKRALNMKKFFKIFTLGLALIFATDVSAEENAMKVRLTFSNNEVLIKLEENDAVSQLLQMLPAEFNFTDFAGEEKITNFPRSISLENVSGGMIATAGKLFIYAPWKNMGIFYKTHSYLPDRNLIELGEVESGLELLAKQRANFTARMEIVK